MALTVTALVLLGGCAAPDQAIPSSLGASTDTSREASTTDHPSSSAVEDVEGTVVAFRTGSDSVEVTIGEDTPATRGFLRMLPMTVSMDEFNGKEKVADLPCELEYEGSPGSDPEDGDLIYFVPWGNIGFYYDADGIKYSDDTIHLGTYDANEDELARFEGQETRVEIVK